MMQGVVDMGLWWGDVILLELLTGREMCRGSGFAILCWRFCCLLLGRDSFTVLYYLILVAFVQSRINLSAAIIHCDFRRVAISRHSHLLANFGSFDFVDMKARIAHPPLH